VLIRKHPVRGEHVGASAVQLPGRRPGFKGLLFQGFGLLLKSNIISLSHDFVGLDIDAA